MKIINRDINFYVGCYENAKNNLINAAPNQELLYQKIRDAYSDVILKLNYLKHVIQK